MKAVLSLFRIRFLNGLQYRTAALAGMATQFVWGGMIVLLYKALHASNPAALPMELSALCSYVWLQQAFLALFNVWTVEKDLLNMVYDGSVGYELCRPMDIYTNWYIKSLSTRVSRAVLRCMPVLIFALLLPQPYGLSLPKDPIVFGAFLLSGILGSLVVVAFIMLIYLALLAAFDALFKRFPKTRFFFSFIGEAVKVAAVREKELPVYDARKVNSLAYQSAFVLFDHIKIPVLCKGINSIFTLVYSFDSLGQQGFVVVSVFIIFP